MNTDINLAIIVDIITAVINRGNTYSELIVRALNPKYTYKKDSAILAAVSAATTVPI